jgi:hypothetical protein
LGLVWFGHFIKAPFRLWVLSKQFSVLNIRFWLVAKGAVRRWRVRSFLFADEKNAQFLVFAKRVPKGFPQGSRKKFRRGIVQAAQENRVDLPDVIEVHKDGPAAKIPFQGCAIIEVSQARKIHFL